MSTNSEPDYACPHIDAVLGPLEEVWPYIPERFLKWTIKDMKAAHQIINTLREKSKANLERVRSICEELRADRTEFELEKGRLSEQVDELKERVAGLEKALEEANATIDEYERS